MVVVVVFSYVDYAGGGGGDGDMDVDYGGGGVDRDPGIINL